jgi:hypothetical protein
VREAILRVEKVNFDPDGKQQELYGYAIAAKRPCSPGTQIVTFNVAKASAHGLGFLYPPEARTRPAI